MLTVYDSKGNRGSAMCQTVAVSGGTLSAVIVEPANPATTIAGTDTNFRGTAAGGVPPYAYSWSFPGASETSGTGAGPLARAARNLGPAALERRSRGPEPDAEAETAKGTFPPWNPA